MTKYREPRLEVVAYGQELKQYLELPHSRSLYEGDQHNDPELVAGNQSLDAFDLSRPNTD
jgi:hypothetical protein